MLWSFGRSKGMKSRSDARGVGGAGSRLDPASGDFGVRLGRITVVGLMEVCFLNGTIAFFNGVAFFRMGFFAMPFLLGPFLFLCGRRFLLSRSNASTSHPSILLNPASQSPDSTSTLPSLSTTTIPILSSGTLSTLLPFLFSSSVGVNTVVVVLIIFPPGTNMVFSRVILLSLIPRGSEFSAEV